MDLLLPWSFSRNSTASLNAWTTCITHTSLGTSSRSEPSSKTIDKYSLRLKTKEVVKYSLRTIFNKQAIGKKKVAVSYGSKKTLLILHYKVIYFCLKELLLCRFINALRRNYLNLLLVSSSWASTKVMTSTTLLKNKSTFIFFNVALKRVTASRGISCL